jgi:hypothetical protein
MEGSGQLHASAALPTVKSLPKYLLDRGWVGSGDDLDSMEKGTFGPYWESNTRHPTRSPSLYRLSYRGSYCTSLYHIKYVGVLFSLVRAEREKSTCFRSEKGLPIYQCHERPPPQAVLEILVFQWVLLYSGMCRYRLGNGGRILYQ